MSTEKDFYSVREVAEKFGISKDGVYRLIRKKEIPVHKIGGAIRISQADLEDYLKRVKK